MKIFLDFDGVLRRDSSPKMRLDADCVQHLESALLSSAEARVVISSTWRLVHRIGALRSLFSADFASRIEGVTPDLPEEEEYVRHAEVRAYLARGGFHGVRWIAIDDDPEQFRPDAPVLKVDPGKGFDAACAARLREWLSKR